jgi:SAM-dependent methyltransferase
MEFSGKSSMAGDAHDRHDTRDARDAHDTRDTHENRLFYDLEQIGKHYRKVLEDKTGDYYERFDPDILDKRPMVKTLIERTFDRFFPEKVPVLLDVGCGTCFYFPLLSERAETLLGIDVCIPMLDMAQELIERKGLENCHIRESSAMDLPFEDESIDVVHSWDFLHHVPDVPKALSEITRVLKPGGRYIAVEPNIVNPSILWYHLRRRAEWGLTRKNQFSLPRRLRKNGFDVKVDYDNTIISFLNEKTEWIWKLANGFTAIWPTKYLSFRYMMECVKRP